MLAGIRFRLLTLLVLFASSSFGTVTFDAWTVDNGMPQNRILGLTRARDGYIWMLTPAGMVRFDGLTFQLFGRSNSPGITSNNFVFFSLMEDSRGAIWAGTWDGGAICYRNGSFRAYTTKDGLPNNSVVRIDEDAAGTIWIYTRPGLTSLKDGKLTRVAPLPDSPFNPFLIHPSNFSVQGFLWGLWRYSKSGWERFAFGKWTPFPVPADIRDPRAVRFDWMAEDSQHRLWYRILKRPGEYFVVENSRLRAFHGVGKDEFICYQDHRGRLWSSDAEGHGAFREKGIRRQVSTFSTAAGFMAIEDDEIGLWIATADKGLFHLREPPIAHQFIPANLQKNNIQNLTQDRSGAIWIGGIGLTRWKDGKFRTFYRPSRVADGYWKNTVNSVFVDRDDSLWIGYHDGLARFENNRIVEASGPLAHFVEQVHAMHRDRFGDLWFACQGGAYRLHGNSLTHFSERDGRMAGGVVVMAENAQGMWFGSDHGLSRYRDGRFVTYREADGLSSEHVSALHFDTAGVLWIGTTDGGLDRFKDGAFKNFTVQNGFPNIGVYAIVDDGLGNFWMSSQLGLHRVRKKDLDAFADGHTSRIYVTSFGTSDGLASLDCSGYGQPRSLLARDGTILFPSLNGLAILNPRSIPKYTAPPRVYFRESRVDGALAPAGAPVIVPPGAHDLEIQYAAVAFVKPEQVQFRYRLSGLNSAWTDVGTQRVAYFTHLPAGTYSFEVQAINGDGVTNTGTPSLTLTVRPRIYETWWFWSLCGSLVIVSTYLAWQRRVLQLEKARAAQQNFSRQLIESQEAERKRIAAELHDSLVQRLAVIRNHALLSLKANGSNEEPEDRIAAISAEASQAISEVREISHNLRPYQLDLLGITKAVEAVVHKVAASSPLVLTCKVDNIDDIFEIESAINVFRIVQECLTNIQRHSEATEASVVVSRTGESVVIAIKDNGKGFSQASAGADVRRGGLGLSNISERARLIGGRAQIHTESGKGTEVTIVVDLVRRTFQTDRSPFSQIRALWAHRRA